MRTEMPAADDATSLKHRFRDAVDPDDAVAYRAAGWWGDETLVDHLRRHAAAKPDENAFIADQGSMSWSALDHQSDRIAAVVCDLGIEPGARVAVLLPDGATVHAAYLALEKAGVVTVGIGARAGDREIAHLLRSTRAPTLLTLSEHRGRAASHLRDALADLGIALENHITLPVLEAQPDAAILVNDAPVAPSADHSERFDDRRIGADDLSFINSTSGTTGLPKCVLHFQNRWIYFHSLAVSHGNLTGDETLMSLVPAPFGFGLWTSHFTPILLGSPVVVTERFNAATALAAIERHRVTMLCCVSTQFLMMLNEPAFDRYELSSLRTMFTGGEAVPTERARDFEKLTGCSVLQFYGSNETGVLSGTRLGDDYERRLTTAGRTVPEMQVRLYDAAGEAIVEGEGRPACRGPATCLGYLDADADKGLFTDDGWMLMGDLCRIDEDGYLTVTGRISDFIIRGGKNISAAEVEDEVNTHPAVGLSAAVAIPDEVFGERVCVYVELRQGVAALTLEDLLIHLEKRGTSKEIRPEALVVLPSLPRSSGGKIAKGRIAEDVAERFG